MPPPRLKAILPPEVSAVSLADPAAVFKLVLSAEEPSTLREALHATSIEWTPQQVNTILKLLWNHAPKALLFFNILSHHPSYVHHPSSFDHAIDLSSRLRDFRTTWNLLHRMRSLHFSLTVNTFSILAHRYVSAGRPGRAIQLFFSMHKHGCVQDLNLFNTLLDVLCKSRKMEIADKLFVEVSGKFRPDVASYNIMANGWCLAKKVPRALGVLKKMVVKGLSPNLSSYNIILNGYFRVGQADKAWKFYLEMKKRCCEADVVTYTTLIHGLGELGEIKRARKVFDCMAEEGVLPSVVTYNALIQALCRKDCAKNAVLVLEEMARKGYAANVMTYNLVIKGLCREGKIESGLEVMKRMKMEKLEPNVQTYNVIIRCFCDAGEIEGGMDMVREMEVCGCLPNADTYNVMISGMLARRKREDVVGAGRLVVEMVERGFYPRNITFNRVLDGLLLTGNQEVARHILRLLSGSGPLPRGLRL